jgi:2-polyprenyl-3-methyl-5-hydroxy-6-metoxy-1,4-benzoquinol methylase
MTPQISAVKQTLADSTVHQIWERTHRNTQSERLHERVFDWIAGQEALQGKRALDIGCGIGQHAIRLAKRGCEVVAADFSADRVAVAKDNIERQGFGSHIRVCSEDLAAGLSFTDGSFDVVLCWGVLMHIPKFLEAARELVRVTRSGGRILVWEPNRFGVDAIITLASSTIKRAAGTTGSRRLLFTEFGREYWYQTPSGELLTRHSSIPALVRFFKGQDCCLRHRIAAEFTELYGLGGAVARLAHLWNRGWFAAGHIPYLAHGNVLVFERTSPALVSPKLDA